MKTVGLICAVKWISLMGALACTQTGCAELATRREIRGRVQFAETGAPVAHATVIIEQFGSPSAPFELPPVAEVVRTETAQNGTFSLRIPEHRYLAIRVLGENCQWNGTAARLDKISDLDALLELAVTQWEC